MNIIPTNYIFTASYNASQLLIKLTKCSFIAAFFSLVLGCYHLVCVASCLKCHDNPRLIDRDADAHIHTRLHIQAHTHTYVITHMRTHMHTYTHTNVLVLQKGARLLKRGGRASQ